MDKHLKCDLPNYPSVLSCVRGVSAQQAVPGQYISYLALGNREATEAQ
jgi:hypothetical protein